MGNTNARIMAVGSNSYATFGQNITLSPDTALSALAGIQIGGNGYLLASNGARVLTLGTDGSATINANINQTLAGYQISTAGNIVAAGFVSAVGNITGGNIIGTLANGNSNIVISSNGNITAYVSGLQGLFIASNKVTLGSQAGQTNQGNNSVAIGGTAGENNQGANAVAIGQGAGTNGQGANSVAVGSSAGGLVTYYFNGQAVGTNSAAFAQWISNGGEAVAHSDNYWNGDLPVVAVYGRALNASEIQQNHNALAPRYGLGIVTTGLVANYDTAGYSSGSTVADTSGNGRSLTLYNTPTATTANRSPVLSYNGSSQYAQDNTGYGNVLNTGSGYTFDIWANPSSITNGTLLAEWGSNNFASGWTDAQMGFLNNIVAGYFSGASVTYTPVSTGNWYNITFTYNGSNQGTLYINGTAQGTTGVVAKSESPSGTWVSLAHPDASGAYLGGLNGYYSGQAGPWKVYSQALTPTQVSQNFNALRSRYGV